MGFRTKDEVIYSRVTGNTRGEFHKQMEESGYKSSSDFIEYLGIHTSRVQDDDFVRQLALFDEVDYEKLAKIDETVDTIRERFGIDAVKRAIFVDQPIDHMSGGISREKRSVDYDKIVVQ